MKIMQLHYLTGIACLFLCGSVGANVSDCQQRNLSVTVNNIMRLFIDGVEITGLPNADKYLIPDTVELPCTAKVIGIEGTDIGVSAGVRASTDDGYVLTNSSWKCTNIYFTGWQAIDFDDSDWPSAYAASEEIPVSGIRNDSIWIWTNASTYDEGGDRLVYCRKTLASSSVVTTAPAPVTTSQTLQAVTTDWYVPPQPCTRSSAVYMDLGPKGDAYGLQRSPMIIPRGSPKCIVVCDKHCSASIVPSSLTSCTQSPCQHSGTCIQLSTGYRCQCRTGFTGTNCAQELDCDGVTCAERIASHG